MEQEGRGGSYSRLIVLPREHWRSPGERPLIADVQELKRRVSSQKNRSGRNVRYKPRLMLLIHQLMNLAN